MGSKQHASKNALNQNPKSSFKFYNSSWFRTYVPNKKKELINFQTEENQPQKKDS